MAHDESASRTGSGSHPASGALAQKAIIRLYPDANGRPHEGQLGTDSLAHPSVPRPARVPSLSRSRLGGSGGYGQARAMLPLRHTIETLYMCASRQLQHTHRARGGRGDGFGMLSGLRVQTTSCHGPVACEGTRDGRRGRA